jgi:mono/diheme cytochrome c family protein
MRSAILTIFIACSACREADVSAIESAGARTRGRELFVAHCALCHGERADGVGRMREGLTSKPADFTRASWREGRTPPEVFATIRDGVPGRSMPAWRSLDDRALWDLTAYVWSVSEVGP